jgi:DNA-binding transcriptional MerR regulator
MRGLTIGQLAEQAHVNRETVRYYERRRLLQRPLRSIAGYRGFSDDALRRLQFIRHAKMLGFSLEEIKDLLALRVRSIDRCERFGNGR